MSGRRPDRTQVWNFLDNFRQTVKGVGPGADWTTLPENFKRNGYFVTGTGEAVGLNIEYSVLQSDIACCSLI
jgi:hypothetical protein